MHLRTTNVVESPLQLGETEDGCSEALQERSECHRNDLEAAAGRGEELPHFKRSLVVA